MKSIAIMALLGVISLNNVSAEKLHFEISGSKLGNQEKMWMAELLQADNSEESDSEDSGAENVMTHGSKILEDKDSFKGWLPHMEEFPGTVNQNGNFIEGYERQVPEVFSADSADDGYYSTDKFTQNMIKNHAIEGVDKGPHKEPKRTHKFYLTPESAKAAATEILATHFGMNPAESSAFLAKNFDANWNYYDVNQEGRLDVVGSGTFMRRLTHTLGTLDLQ